MACGEGVALWRAVNGHWRSECLAFSLRGTNEVHRPPICGPTMDLGLQRSSFAISQHRRVTQRERD